MLFNTTLVSEYSAITNFTHNSKSGNLRNQMISYRGGLKIRVALFEDSFCAHKSGRYELQLYQLGRFGVVVEFFFITAGMVV